MNPMQQMRDPSAGIAPQLLPHMHLISKQRFPQNNNPSLEAIISYLLEAPKTLNETQPVQWQLLDCPTDGTILLTWQAPDLGTTFASDGYIWNDAEAMMNCDVRGYNLQMYLHRAGFRPGADTVACHSRRRYRLTPSQQNIVADPSIWIVHYSKAQPSDHVPAASIPVPPQINAQMQQRRVIFSQGALARKDFMLRDRGSWPTVNAPGAFGRQGQPPGAQHRRGPSISVPEPTVEEEEDVSRGDVWDFMTPRDVSRMRYEQHHEWMEEVLESPYRTLSIVPPELGLGRKGELETLTKGFFEAPTAVQESTGAHPAKVGRMDPGKAEEFTKLANQRLADMQAELDKMRQAHQKRMEKLKKTSTLGTAEKRLRALHLDAGRSKTNTHSDVTAQRQDGLDDIAREVEESVGKKIHQIRPVHMVAKGGFQPDLSSQVSVAADKEQAQLTPNPVQPQVVQATGALAQTQPEPTSTAAVTVQTVQEQTERPQETLTKDGNGISESEVDVDMDGIEEEPNGNVPTGEAGDWVMVDDQDLNLVDSGDNYDADGQALATSDPAIPAPAAVAVASASGEQQQQQQGQSTPQHIEGTSAGQTPLDTVDFDLDNDFDNTAGDALAGFNAADELELDAMDDSAFGDAFPPQD